MTVLQKKPEEIFQKQWLSYQTLLREDYLEHRALYEAIQKIVLERASQQPVAMLDLGCGDSDYVARMLEAAGGGDIVESYTGVDLSKPAMAISVRNIERALGGTAKAQWHHSNFVDFCSSCRDDFHIILMSFSLHHLNQAGKGALLKQAHRLLQSRKGCFILIDIYRLPGESLAEYHDRQQHDVTSRWTALSVEERRGLTDHMLQFDMPETHATMEALGEAAGYTTVKVVKESQNKLASVVLFQI